MRYLYVPLAIAGGAIPYYFFVSFLLQNGLDLPLLVQQLFATDISTFFAVDVILTAVALLFFVYRESKRRAIRNWGLYALVTVAVGPSCALPLFLFAREGSPQSPL